METFEPNFCLPNRPAANLRDLPGGRRMFRNPVTDLIVVAVVALLIFGPKRLPMLGRSLGQGMREFKDGIMGESKHDDEEDRPALTPAAAADPAPVPEPAATPVGSSPGAERQSPEAGSSEPRA
jgi:sec-independent protein translocase protein TatA